MLHGVRLANGFFRPGSGIHDGSMMQQMAFAPASVIDVTKAGPMLLCGLEGIGGLVPYPMQQATQRVADYRVAVTYLSSLAEGFAGADGAAGGFFA